MLNPDEIKELKDFLFNPDGLKLVGIFFLILTFITLIGSSLDSLSVKTTLNHYLFGDKGNVGLIGGMVIFISMLLTSTLTAFLYKKIGNLNLIHFLVIFATVGVIFYIFNFNESLHNPIIYFSNLSHIFGYLYAFIDILLFYLFVGLVSILLGYSLLIVAPHDEKEIIVESGGLAASLLSLGCIGCGSLLWAVLGGLGATLFPLGGLEIKIISLILLIISIKLIVHPFGGKIKVEFKAKGIDLKK